MSAQIFVFPKSPMPPPPNGNGAPELVKEYLDVIHPARTLARAVVGDDLPAGYLPDHDYFLAWLWSHGYIIKKLEE